MIDPIMMMNAKKFTFSDNYTEAVMSLQPEVYTETRRIIESELANFSVRHGQKPVVLDIGAAGLMPYDSSLAEKITVVDLFPRPGGINLPENASWVIADILSDSALSKLRAEKYDFIIMSNLLHHLCDARNNSKKHLAICMQNSRVLLSENGRIYIFESLCSRFMSRLQDALYPAYSFILKKLLKFSFVRMFSFREIEEAVSNCGMKMEPLYFKQPKNIAQVFWRVPLKFYPLRLYAIAVFRGADE